MYNYIVNMLIALLGNILLVDCCNRVFDFCLRHCSIRIILVDCLVSPYGLAIPDRFSSFFIVGAEKAVWLRETIGSSHCRSALDKNFVFAHFTPTPGGKLSCSDCLYLTYARIFKDCVAVDTLKQHWQEAKFDVFLLSKCNAYGLWR